MKPDVNTDAEHGTTIRAHTAANANGTNTSSNASTKTSSNSSTNTSTTNTETPREHAQGRWQFRSFALRLAVWTALLLLLLLLGIYIAIENTLERNARSTISEALDVTSSALGARLDDQRRVLLDKLRLLSSDFAFKQAWADGDHDTLRSALDNHRDRVHADLMQLIDLDGNLLVSTDDRDQISAPHPDNWLLQRASSNEFGEASGFVFEHGELYQFVLSPLFTPQHSAWVVLGTRLGDQFVGNLSTQTRSDITLLWQAQNVDAARELVRVAGRLPEQRGGEAALLDVQADQIVDIDAGHYLLKPITLDEQPKGRAVALLMRSFDDAMAPFYRLRDVLIIVCVSGLLLAIAASAVLARRVTEPVRRLADSARALQAGSYAPVAGVRQADELGALATQFNHMLQGLQERDAARGLLGKVVSSAVAEELLQNPPTLGGELRNVSLLFTDIRDFTSISERYPATTLIEFLNVYLSQMSTLIDQHNGVVDKYIGDAIMAIFGAPLQRNDHARAAVLSALAMQRAVRDLHGEFAARGWPQLRIGVGIHSGDAVVGNMGSANRLNYTAIGDTVNLASRLEGLSKYYGWSVLVSDSTRDAAADLDWLELDRVRVKGRSTPVGIYAALDAGDADALQRDDAGARFALALAHWQAARLTQAQALFRALSAHPLLAISASLHARRCEYYLQQGLPPDWDGVYDYDAK